MTALAPMFPRIEPRLQAAKYVRAVMSELPRRNGWTIAEWIGDRRPDATQRLLNRARWDTAGAMSTVRRFAVTRLDAATRPGSLTVGVLDESGQEKKGTATAGVKRQHMGCAERHRQRHQHRLPRLRARRGRARADRRPAMDPRRADQRPGHRHHHRSSAGPQLRDQG
ncbi:transposase [Nonomuraea ferruginea]